MKSSARFVITLGLAFSLTGCLNTRADLKEAESRRKMQDQVVTAQEKRANELARLEDYDQQFRAMNGRLDVIENHLAQYNASQAGQNDQEKRLKEESDRKFRSYEEALRKLEDEVSRLNEEVKALQKKKETAEIPPSRVNAFDAAEESYKKKEWKQAIVDYEAYRKSNPKGKNYPAATLKIGMAFHELNMKDEAKAFFEEVVAKFPTSKEAKKASQRLKAAK